uniref:ATP synthase F0 subunit 8 n=1 Tax=Pseudempusa pinnapavonis TaxID=1661850 RepID=UPI0030012E64
MPQMMPLNWFCLFLFFLLSLKLFSLLNFYSSFNKFPHLFSLSVSKKSSNWKW